MPPITEYCVLADIPKLGIAQAALRAIAEPDLTDAIKSASSFMDSYLSGRFVLPFVAVDQAMRECCAVIAAWTAVGTKRLGPNEDVEENVLRIRYNDKVKWLQAIAEGDVTPTVTDSSTTPTTSGSGAPLVTSNQQRGWYSIDSDVGGPFTGRR